MLGRGSNCVNTGGEKVYPEEVEMAIKGHPAVYDALVVGVPDERYGQAVAAVVELRDGHDARARGPAHLPARPPLRLQAAPGARGRGPDPAQRDRQGAVPARQGDRPGLGRGARRPTPSSRRSLTRAHPALRRVRHRAPDLRLHALRARRRRGLARGRARRPRLRALQRRRRARPDPDLARRQHRRQALRRRRRDADEGPDRGHLGRPRRRTSPRSTRSSSTRRCSSWASRRCPRARGARASSAGCTRWRARTSTSPSSTGRC